MLRLSRRHPSCLDLTNTVLFVNREFNLIKNYVRMCTECIGNPSQNVLKFEIVHEYPSKLTTAESTSCPQDLETSGYGGATT